MNGSGEKVGVKDDSSVLAFPNHTVLNHLMTSNVKNGVLATAVTTRYKKKVCESFLSSTQHQVEPMVLVTGEVAIQNLANFTQYVTTISFKPVPKQPPFGQ